MVRLATYVHEGKEQYGVVVQHPGDGRDWVFAPSLIERMIDASLAVKGSGSKFRRPQLIEGNRWPADLVGLLALGETGLDAARRLAGFVVQFAGQGDPVLLKQAGTPVEMVQLRSPVPRPRLLLGAVGNNAPFLRNDPPRARNLHQPSCHQRALTSIIGPGEPFVIPAESGWWHATTELAIVIGTGGRNIAREHAFDAIAGYTIVNDSQPSCYVEYWEQHDKAVPLNGVQFHASNTSSWLGKTADGMCSVGPYLVTQDEVGDPYDLMSYLRENGQIRNRAWSGALMTGIEETIFWLSRFMTLEPGMIIHLGAMGQDGVRIDPDAKSASDYISETEIERVGVLRNPIVLQRLGDWRDDAARDRSPVPVIRDLIDRGEDRITSWHPRDVRHLWALSGNSAGSAIPPRPYPLPYLAPPSAVSASGGTVCIPAHAGTVSVGCELGAVIGKLITGVTAEEAAKAILGYVPIAVLRDSSFADSLLEPHILNANMPEVYARWPDGFNVCGLDPVQVDTMPRAMRVIVDGVSSGEASTGDYLLDAPHVIADLAKWITLLPGDVIALGQVGPLINLPPNVEGLRVTASIDGIGESHTVLIHERAVAQA